VLGGRRAEFDVVHEGEEAMEVVLSGCDTNLGSKSSSRRENDLRVAFADRVLVDKSWLEGLFKELPCECNGCCDVSLERKGASAVITSECNQCRRVSSTWCGASAEDALQVTKDIHIAAMIICPSASFDCRRLYGAYILQEWGRSMTLFTLLPESTFVGADAGSSGSP
jgi:hypothetical protein